MSTDHLIHCKCTNSQTREKLKGAALDVPSLKPYCSLIVKLYGLEDANDNDAKGVVWGECPSIPSGYDGAPKNINIDFALDLDSSRDESDKLQSGEGDVATLVAPVI